VIVWGLLGRYPYGGVTWQVLHHLAGLKALGYDVWYVEDSQSRVYSPTTHWKTMEYAENVAFVRRWMEWLGLGERWAFRPPGSTDEVIGLTRERLSALYAEADVVINLCGAQEVRAPEHDGIRHLLYLQTDPVEEQVRVAQGDAKVIARLDAHDVHFAYAENFGAADCEVPLERYAWRTTRPPVVRSWWHANGDRPRMVLSTVANWKHDGKDVAWRGETWHWSKDREFRRIVDLPARSSLPLELALGSIDDDDISLVTAAGWNVVDSIAEPDEYRSYIRNSAGELTVAKEQYVRPRSGWFSDRSACYLAAGRPVVTQDTGFGTSIPTGEGLFAFSTMDEAAAAIEAIATDYERHAEAALEISREYFDARRVLRRMLEEAGVA
jgi:hypothetical protein